MNIRPTEVPPSSFGAERALPFRERSLTESSHIFIDMGLKASASPAPHILEIGFGTGLNALLTLIEAERSGRQIHYTGIELYPLPWETVEKLRYNDRPGGW